MKAVKNAGIRRITGNIIGDGTIYAKEMTPSTWSWENIGNYFGAVPNGLTVHDNYATLHFKTGKEGTTAVYMGCEPEIKGLRVETAAVAADIKRENTNTFGKTYQKEKYIEGPMPQNNMDVTVRTIIPDPAQFAASQLLDSLNSNGIQVFGQALSAFEHNRYVLNEETPQTVICTIESPTLAEIIQQTNYYSINLYAEHCLALVGLKQVNTTNVDLACYALMNF